MNCVKQCNMFTFCINRRIFLSTWRLDHLIHLSLPKLMSLTVSISSQGTHSGSIVKTSTKRKKKIRLTKPTQMKNLNIFNSSCKRNNLQKNPKINKKLKRQIANRKQKEVLASTKEINRKSKSILATSK